MTPRTRITLYVGVLAALLGGAFLAQRAANETSRAVAAIDHERMQILQRLNEVNEKLDAAKNSAPHPAPFSGAEASDAHSPTEAVTPKRNFAQINRDDPKLQAFRHASRSAELFITYNPLYRSLGLSPTQVQQVEEAILRREEQSEDIRSVAHSDADRASAKKLIDGVNAEYRAALRDVVGTERAKQVQDYERQIQIREIVGGLAGAAAMAGIPLNGTQAEQLAGTLTQVARPFPNSSWVDPRQIDWSRAQQQARSFLSPAQLTFIDTTEPPATGQMGRFTNQLNSLTQSAIESDAPSVVGKATATR